MQEFDYHDLADCFENNDTFKIYDTSEALNGELEELLQNVHDRTDVAGDELSDALIPLDVPDNLTALKTTGDGNCLYHSISLALSGKSVCYSPNISLF